jgi:hypothetical protein
MLFGKSDKKQKRAPRARASQLKLHSVAALLKERRFDGSFEIAGLIYQFTYAPLKAQVAGQRLLLRGPLTVTNSRGQARAKENVGMLLASTQGGIGTAPVRSQALIGGVVPAAPAVPTPQQPSTTSAAPPVVESTGSLSFCGVMYFQLEPLEGRQLGVPADLSRVQLNVRLAPTDNDGRALHGIYSAIVEALYGQSVDARLAARSVAELNKALQG